VALGVEIEQIGADVFAAKFCRMNKDAIISFFTPMNIVDDVMEIASLGAEGIAF
jgi:hypothetical protein